MTESMQTKGASGSRSPSAHQTVYHYLSYNKGWLQMGKKSLKRFTKNYQGPLYIYDLALMESRLKIFQKAFPQISVFYAMKANNHPRILKSFKKLGAGCDVVSAGEAKWAIDCGVKPEKIIFSGVGKTVAEIDFALSKNLRQLNVESLSEMKRIGERAKSLRKKAEVLFRLNPDVNVQTHPYIATGFRSNKFGIDACSLNELVAIVKKYEKNILLRGVSLHIGSQLLDMSSYDEAFARAVPVYRNLQQQGFPLDRFDIGGGLGIDYQLQNLEQEKKMMLSYAAIVEKHIRPLGCELQAEPGRWIVGHAGALLCQIQYRKKMPAKDFLVVDSGMHHLLRPSLYKSYHRILPLQKKTTDILEVVDVVGPICESSDTLAWDRELPQCQEGDFLLVADAGAYGASMSSDYNLHKKAKAIFL